MSLFFWFSICFKWKLKEVTNFWQLTSNHLSYSVVVFLKWQISKTGMFPIYFHWLPFKRKRSAVLLLLTSFPQLRSLKKQGHFWQKSQHSLVTRRCTSIYNEHVRFKTLLSLISRKVQIWLVFSFLTYSQVTSYRMNYTSVHHGHFVWWSIFSSLIGWQRSHDPFSHQNMDFWQENRSHDHYVMYTFITDLHSCPPYYP